jgi:hypothetical protein
MTQVTRGGSALADRLCQPVDLYPERGDRLARRSQSGCDRNRYRLPLPR